MRGVCDKMPSLPLCLQHLRYRLQRHLFCQKRSMEELKGRYYDLVGRLFKVLLLVYLLFKTCVFTQMLILIESILI